MKKVLIISYYWPPSGGISVLRSLKITKYLRQYGWEPILFIPKNADYPSYDKSNLNDVPKDLEIIQGRIVEPFNIYRFLTGRRRGENVINVLVSNEKKRGLLHKLSVWIRSNFFIPDARSLWIRPSVRKLEKYLATNHIDAIFSDGPPHTNTRIACLLSKSSGIPWLADFQDPWTQVDYYQLLSLTKFGHRRHVKMEQEVFKTAGAISIVSQSWKSDLEKIGAKNVSVVPWGFDPDDYRGLSKVDDEFFCFTHSGLLGFDRNPKLFFEVLKEICDTDKLFSKKLRLRFIGQTDYTVVNELSRLGLKENLILIGNVSRKESLNYISSSPILLLLLNQQPNAKGRIPGKLFEYLAVRRPIVCLGIEKGDSANILKETNAGLTFSYENKDDLREYILKLWSEYKKGLLIQPIKSNIDKYSSVKVTQNIAQILNSLVE